MYFDASKKHRKLMLCRLRSSPSLTTKLHSFLCFDPLKLRMSLKGEYYIFISFAHIEPSSSNCRNFKRMSLPESYSKSQLKVTRMHVYVFVPVGIDAFYLKSQWRKWPYSTKWTSVKKVWWRHIKGSNTQSSYTTLGIMKVCVIRLEACNWVENLPSGA